MPAGIAVFGSLSAGLEVGTNVNAGFKPALSAPSAEQIVAIARYIKNMSYAATAKRTLDHQLLPSVSGE